MTEIDPCLGLGKGVCSQVPGLREDGGAWVSVREASGAEGVAVALCSCWYYWSEPYNFSYDFARRPHLPYLPPPTLFAAQDATARTPVPNTFLYTSRQDAVAASTQRSRLCNPYKAIYRTDTIANRYNLMSSDIRLECVPSSLFRSSYHTLTRDGRSSPLRLYGLSSPSLTTLSTSSQTPFYAITQQGDTGATVVVASWTSVVQSFSYKGGEFADPKCDPLAVLVSGEERSEAICHEVAEEGVRPERRELEGRVVKFAMSGSDILWLTGDGSLLCAR